MTQDDSDFKERQRLYERTRDELAANIKSMSETYDRALFTLSSAFLGGSLAFIGHVIDLKTANLKWMLYWAWLFFALTIVLTLVSFIYGLFTSVRLQDVAERYYMQGIEEAWKVSKSVQRLILCFALACGVSFVLGIVLLSGFVYINVLKESAMSQQSSAPERVQKSVPPSTFQRPVPAAPATGDSGATQTTPQTPTTQTTPQKQG